MYATICSSLLSYHLLACNLSTVKTEISKHHGPEWGLIVPPCSKESIKTHLDEIIHDPTNVLKEFSKEHQSFLYRNAVKSYGHFATTDADLNNLSKLFNDQNGHFERYFGESSKFAKLVVLESIANTGSPEGLELFKQILENEDSDLFYKNSAADYALWILDGVPTNVYDHQHSSANQIQGFYPNILTKANERFANNDDDLMKLQEIKGSLNKTIDTLLLNPDKYGKIFTNLNKLKQSLDRDDLSSSLDSDNSDKRNGNYREPKSAANKKINKLNDVNRKIASSNSNEESTSQRSIFWWLIIAALSIGLTIVFLVLNKKRP